MAQTHKKAIPQPYKTSRKDEQRFFSKNSKLGKNQKKVLLLLFAGVALAGTPRLSGQLRVLKEVTHEWQSINRDTLHRTVRSLYKAKLIKRVDHQDGSTTLVLTDEGIKRAFRYNLDTMRIRKPATWDGKWRMVIYDVPENLRQLRMDLLMKLKQLGFVELQQSVFVHPYECRNEIEYLIELYDARQYVRRCVLAEIDDDTWLRRHYNLHTNQTTSKHKAIQSAQ